MNAIGWKQEDVFPIIERLIEDRFAQTNEWVSSREVAERLLIDGEGIHQIKRAKRRVPGKWTLRRWATNMVAWYSKCFTDERDGRSLRNLTLRFERDRQVVYRYRPASKRVEAGAPEVLEVSCEPIDFRLPERVQMTCYRILRDSATAKEVKRLHDYCCQICGSRIELPDGGYYAEAHHVRPLGRKHRGSDKIGNIMCVCPNHHAQLDYGCLRLDLTKLRAAIGHSLMQESIDYHNARVFASCV